MRIPLPSSPTLLGSCAAPSAPVLGPARPVSTLPAEWPVAPQRCVPISATLRLRPASSDPNLPVYGIGKKI